jgi:type III secretory pathway component EscV
MINEGVMLVAAVLAVLFTIVMIFTNWLFLLQFATIAASVITGFLLRQSKNHSDVKQNGWAVIAIAAYIIYDQLQSGKKEPVQQPKNSISSPQKQSSVQASAAPLPQAITESQRLDDVIARLESKYPEFNENSYAFNQVLIDKALSLQKFHIRNGDTPSLALLKAGEEVMMQQNTSRQAAPQGPPQFVQRQQKQLTNDCKRPDGTITPPPCRRGDQSYIHN